MAQRGSRPSPGGRGPGRNDNPFLFLLRPYSLLLAGVVIILGTVLVVIATTGGSDNKRPVDALVAAHAAFPADLARGSSVGKEDAPIELVAFEDFQCPFCLLYTIQDEPFLVSEYVKTGKLQITFQHLPLLGIESTKAALAAECAADQDKFWDYQNKLFTVQAAAGQATGEKTNVGRFSDAKLKDYAGELGLDRALFDPCYDSSEHLQKVQDDQRLALSFGISGTPGFLVNGSPLNGRPGSIQEWRTFLDGYYTQLTGTPAATTGTPQATTAPTAAATPTPTKTP